MQHLYRKLSVLACVLASTLAAQAQSFSVEEPLQPVPASTVRAVGDHDDLSRCQYVGKRVNLGVQGTRTAYLVTTADTCDGGAAAAPIWVVAVGPAPAVLLASGGASAQLRSTGAHGWRDIVIAQAKAGSAGESLWRFDGAKYRRVRPRVGANSH